MKISAQFQFSFHFFNFVYKKIINEKFYTKRSLIVVNTKKLVPKEKIGLSQRPLNFDSLMGWKLRNVNIYRWPRKCIS